MYACSTASLVWSRTEAVANISPYRSLCFAIRLESECNC